ncbi:RNA polymerase sigma factor RpoE [Burkholderiales bacterium GJ-E10]|nr:RNA polymerase sigma factor RpoE [Burkholderiales bacterium GJ-E10]
MSERDADWQLVRRVQHGDKRAFEILVAKYQRKISRLLARMIRDPSDIEDVTQEAFIKAYRALPSFRGESAFYTWLYRIAINTAKNHFAAQGRKAPTVAAGDFEDADGGDEPFAQPDVDTPESVYQSRQIGLAVNRAIDQLPEELRTAIVLRELEGLSYDEIAAAMNCPVGTVRSRIFRAREAIAQELRPLLDTPQDKRW